MKENYLSNENQNLTLPTLEFKIKTLNSNITDLTNKAKGLRKRERQAQEAIKIVQKRSDNSSERTNNLINYSDNLPKPLKFLNMVIVPIVLYQTLNLTDEKVIKNQQITIDRVRESLIELENLVAKYEKELECLKTRKLEI